MKKVGAVLVMIVLGFFGIDFLGSYHSLDPVEPGDELELHVNVKNPLDRSFDDVSVKAVFFDLGDYVVSPEFDLDNYENNGIRLFVPVPEDTPAGDQLVKISVSSDELRDSKYIYFTVI